MKAKVYLNIGHYKGKTKVTAHSKPNYKSIEMGNGNRSYPIPTVMVALELEIPDKEFDNARILLQTKIRETIPAVEIKQISAD